VTIIDSWALLHGLFPRPGYGVVKAPVFDIFRSRKLPVAQVQPFSFCVVSMSRGNTEAHVSYSIADPLIYCGHVDQLHYISHLTIKVIRSAMFIHLNRNLADRNYTKKSIDACAVWQAYALGHYLVTSYNLPQSLPPQLNMMSSKTQTDICSTPTVRAKHQSTIAAASQDFGS
jgi:hypothetical protein